MKNKKEPQNFEDALNNAVGIEKLWTSTGRGGDGAGYYSLRGFYFGNEPPNFEDTLYERHGDPRTYGLTFRYDF